MNRWTLANAAWRLASLNQARRFSQALENPAETQKQILLRLLRRNESTAFGEQHGFDAIRTIKDFQENVPVRAYDAFEPWIKRITAGENHVLTREPVRRLVPTSGSSAARKLIPWTKSLQKEFNRAIGPWIVDLFVGAPELMHGPAYWSVSPTETTATAHVENDEHAVPVGFEDDSTYVGGFLKPLIDAALAVPLDVRHIQNVDAFRYATLLFMLRSQELRLVSVWHPSFLTLLLDALPRYWNRLLVDLEKGSFSPPGDIDYVIRDRLSKRLSPISSRARALRDVEPHDIMAIWPHLRLISCWTDARASEATAGLSRRAPGVSIQPKGLLATEAFVSIPYAGKRPLAVCSHLFEFLGDDGCPYLAHQLKPGESYTVVVTTGGGLYRYNLGDRIEVTGYIQQTPSIRFLGRSDRTSDYRGEKLSDAFVQQIIERLFANTTGIRFVMLAPDERSNGLGYTLYVEAGVLPPELFQKLEAMLCENPHYAHARRLGQLASLKLFRIRDSAHEAFLSAPHHAGRQLGDIKPAALDARTGWSDVFNGHYENFPQEQFMISQEHKRL